uniref:Uncharacterized protein n=1 Tax=Rhizophora mucronata TaxID=61149 RepID=A0A2P2KWX2_RHIMU
MPQRILLGSCSLSIFFIRKKNILSVWWLEKTGFFVLGI